MIWTHTVLFSVSVTTALSARTHGFLPSGTWAVRVNVR